MIDRYQALAICMALVVRLIIGRIISLPTLNMLDNLTIYNLHIYYFDNVSLLRARS